MGRRQRIGSVRGTLTDLDGFGVRSHVLPAASRSWDTSTVYTPVLWPRPEARGVGPDGRVSWKFPMRCLRYPENQSTRYRNQRCFLL